MQELPVHYAAFWGKSWIAGEVCVTYRLKEITTLLKFLATLGAKT